MAEGGGDSDVSDDGVFLGPFGDDCGLTLHDLTNPVAGELRTIKNGLILEMIDNIGGRNAEKPKKVADLLCRLVKKKK